MGVGITQHKIQPVEIASGQGILPAAVCGAIKIRESVDVAQIRKLGGKGQRPRGQISLVGINDASKLCPMIAHVSRFQREFAGECMLDAYGPIGHVRSAEVAIHGEGVTRSGVRTHAVTTLDQSCYARWINGRGLVLPGNILRMKRYPSGNNASDAGAAGRTCGVKNWGSRWDCAYAERHRILGVLLRKERIH